jgi:Cu2+-exporting ATPase
MTVTTINVSDMHCASCSNKIRNALSQFADIQQLQFNPVRRQVFITHDDALSSSYLLEQIELAGFHPHLESDSRLVWQESHDLLKRLGVAGLAMMQVMMVQIALYAGAFQGIEDSMRRLLEYTALLFCIPVVVYSAVPFFRSALTSMRHGLNMDAPIALAVFIAFSISLVNTLRGSGEVYYDSVVMFTFLMLGARYLEQRLRHRLGVEDSLQAAMPRTATVVDGAQMMPTPLAEVAVGARLWIAEGEQVPLDGTVDSDGALLEEALLTGESDWQTRKRGEQVFAGTLNRGHGFYLRVAAGLTDSRVAEIDRLANTALDAKHHLARLADKVARVFVPSILFIAAATYLIWSLFVPENALSAALAVLVVSCPCALSLATPAALTAALTRLRQAGILVKNSRALEVADDLAHVFFDKTGTLTDPRTRIVNVHVIGKHSEQQCREYAAALQAHASHPLAEAFKDAAVTPAAGAEVVTAQGVKGMIEGHQVSIGSAEFCGFPGPEAEEAVADATRDKQVYLSIDHVPAAIFTVDNSVRADAASTIDALQTDGLSVHMLSGDNPANCAALAARLGINYVAGSLPEAKPEVLQRAREGKGGVLYVGDGVNDLPALASADVSVATLETTDLVKSKADVLLLTRRLAALCDFLHIGTRSRQIMRQNLLWALLYNLIAIPLAAFGYAPPWAAALGMSISSLIVMANATRILNTPLETD